MSCEIIKQGDAFNWLARPGALDKGVAIDANWSCQMAVYAADGTEEVAPRIVTTKVTHTDSDEYFLVAVTPAEVAALTPGDNHLVIDIKNPSIVPVYGKESEVVFTVAAQRNA